MRRPAISIGSFLATTNIFRRGLLVFFVKTNNNNLEGGLGACSTYSSITDKSGLNLITDLKEGGAAMGLETGAVAPPHGIGKRLDKERDTSLS